MANYQIGTIADIKAYSHSEIYNYDVVKERYQLVDVDMRIAEKWWPKLTDMPSYYHRMEQPNMGIAWYGITLIPPQSLSIFLDAIVEDEENRDDDHILMLIGRIYLAMRQKKYVIIYGI